MACLALVTSDHRLTSTICPHLSRRDLEVFKDADNDGNGTLSKEEFNKAFREGLDGLGGSSRRLRSGFEP